MRGALSRIICVMNQKGGVGKTTTAINLGACLAYAGFEVLVLDLDPQCNATSGLNANPLERHPLVVGSPLSESIVQTQTQRLSLLPGCKNFADITTLAQDNPERSLRLKNQLTSGLTAYDYVLIDSPPSLSALTQTALNSSSQVLMPIQCEFFAMEGVAKMASYVPKQMWENSGILLTMVDPTLELTREVESEVRNFFGDLVYQTVIPRDIALSEAASFGKPVIVYAPRSRGARAYIELCMEVIDYEQE